MDQQPSKGEALLVHVLRRALDKGEGTPRTVLDSVVRGESWETVNALVQEGLLRQGIGSQLFFPSLRMMLRNREDFEDSIAPLQGVIRLGITILEDEDRSDKTATFEEVVSVLLEKFPKLADPVIQRRFGWALFGLEPFISATNAQAPLDARILWFHPSLLDGIETLEDVLAAQDRDRLEEDEKKILRRYADAFDRTGRRHSTPIMLGEDARQDVVLHSLISKDEAELTENRRVIVTEKGLRRGQQVVGGFTADQTPSPPVQEPKPRSSDLEDLIEQLSVNGAFTGDFAAMLSRDAKEVRLCTNAGAYKAVLILCGRILEGVLVDLLNRSPALVQPVFVTLRKGKSRHGFPDAASLPELLKLATLPLGENLSPLLRSTHGDLVKLVNSHRDLVHPRREARGEALPVSRGTATLLNAALCSVLEQISGAIANGWLAKYERAGSAAP